MNNSAWTTKNELMEKLTKINHESNIEKSGIPMMYDEENLYIDTREAHTLVIGSTGSGKTQSTLLPQLRLAIRAGESFVLNDVKSEMYDMVKDDLEKEGYNKIIIDLEKPNNGNKYNPLSIYKILYNKGYKDKALDALENTARYLLSDMNINKNADPFWENTAVNYFVGLALHLFNEKDNVTINDIFEIATSFTNEDLEKYDKRSPVYVNLAGTILAPAETKGSIISVFIQKLKIYVSKEDLSSVISENDFDIESILKEKTAFFIVSGQSFASSTFVPLIINQIYYLATLSKNEKRINILIDEFDKIKPIYNFELLADFSRGMNIRYTVYIKSFLDLKNKYGIEESEIIKYSFGNIIYLLSNDYDTLEEISNLCGNYKTSNGYEKLITPDELKLLSNFEAIILMTRMKPIRTKLIPDYLIEWNK